MANGGGLQTYLSNKAGAMAAAARGLESGDAARDTIAAECRCRPDRHSTRAYPRFQLVSDSGRPSAASVLAELSGAPARRARELSDAHLFDWRRPARHEPRRRVLRFEAENNDATFLGLDTADPLYPSTSARSQAREPGEKRDRRAARVCGEHVSAPTKLVREAQPVDIRGNGRVAPRPHDILDHVGRTPLVALSRVVPADARAPCS